MRADVAQLVERRLAKAQVAGSNPVIRSIRLRACGRYAVISLYSIKMPDAAAQSSMNETEPGKTH